MTSRASRRDLPAPALHPLSMSPEACATWLETIADHTGTSIYRRAAAVLRGKSAGRHETPGDGDRLAEMRFLIDRGDAETAEAAARLVVLTMVPEQRKASTIDRLARKYRWQNPPAK